jgi:hypothetical protein
MYVYIFRICTGEHGQVDHVYGEQFSVLGLVYGEYFTGEHGAVDQVLPRERKRRLV